MTRIVLARRITNISADSLRRKGVQLVTFDLDKVLCEHGSLKVYAEAELLIQNLRNAHITPVIATNSSNRERLKSISETLDNIMVVHKKLDGMRGKPFPDMLIEARSRTGAAGPAVHIDDQLKAYISARLAGYDTFIWLYPRGNPFIQHPITWLLRFVELPVIAVIWAVQQVLGWQKRP